MKELMQRIMETREHKPGSGAYGAIRIATLDDDIVDDFSSDSLVQKFIKAGKLALEGNEVWAWEEDMSTVKSLKRKFGDEID